ncbi:MAG: phosphoribosylaminoimidazolesuccinocarboxamide synthase [Halanaerobiales bacterium]|nr:phosphoribosylaminoimidazolesuccinocarboxamide synthase [Halanaerobiales bacterium]
METKEMIYEGKAKKIYSTDEEDKLIIHYKDDATAFDGKKKGQIKSKGKFNLEISNIFFMLLEDNGIKTHLIRQINDTDILVKKVDIIPIEVVLRNIAAGSLAKRLGLEEGTKLNRPVLEYYYKDDELGDPLINRYHISERNLATEGQLKLLDILGFKINKVLTDFLADKDLLLVDFKLEFGLDKNDNIILADEISPDTCRFWDKNTLKKLDKDRFRRDLGEVEEAYQEILYRLKKDVII